MNSTSAFLSLIALLVCCLSANGQTFSPEERLQGYAHTKDQTTFIFDPSIYDRQPMLVTVTGMFRGWDQNMEAEAWKLMQQGALWTLTVDNTDLETIQPNQEFKFRVDDGAWLDPPAAATNTKGGNLVFMPQAITKALKAELRGPYTIWADILGDRPMHADGYRLTDATGKRIPIAGILPNTARQTLLTTAEPIDIKRVYYLEIPSLDLKAHCSFDGWFRELYSTKPLGANIKGNQTMVRLFAPRAEMVRLYLYQGKDDAEPMTIYEMVQDEQGVWEKQINRNLHGIYYDFTIHGANDPGNHFYESTPVHITDPYARVSDNTWGKARIWQATAPASPLQNGIPKMEEVIAYEVHVQDFTDQLPIDKKLKGTIKGMTIPGLKNKNGEKIGFDYLLDLGINVVHLMPVQEYLHFPDADWKASFKDDPYMIEQGMSEENYQWGYRTSHAFAVESKYRTKGLEPGAEREEFRDLVQAFHDKGIAVIIDIVPNHTAENMDANSFFFNFNAIDKQYYYRTKDLEHIGAYGNEVKTENRPMTQRWIIDQCQHWINEFGIDGFRIDLAGQIDEQTLIALRQALGADKIVYGEAWIGSNDPNYEENPDWDWYKEDSPITFFQDDSRNAFKGPVFELNAPLKDRGWPGGKYDERENVMKGLTNAFPDDDTPLDGISYLDIHDNFALADQFGGPKFDGRTAVDQNLYKIAVTLLHTTLGPIVLHGGSEIMRSKAHAPLKEVVKTTKAGYNSYMHGYRDSYNHRIANNFVWAQVGNRPKAGNTNDYANMYAFWKGLIAFRKSEYGKVFRVTEAVEEDYYQFITPAEESQLGYLVDGKVLVLLNPGKATATFSGIDLPAGTWQQIGNTRAVDHLKGVKGKALTGGQPLQVQLGAESLGIWVLKE
ncbi:MAG: alpha-amylase family glycosyl hydrolase [Bacteroidota bacterium]